MPYIEGERRRADLFSGAAIPEHAGELTYLLMEIVLKYLEAREKINFRALSSAIAALECCKLELYRRVLEPYEDSKITANGDLPYPQFPQAPPTPAPPTNGE